MPAIKRSLPLLLAISVIARTAPAQAPADTVARLDTIMQRLKSLEALRIWPGFRPDTIPVAFVLPAHGSIVLNWPAAIPEGYQPISGVPPRTSGYKRAESSIASAPLAPP